MNKYNLKKEINKDHKLMGKYANTFLKWNNKINQLIINFFRVSINVPTFEPLSLSHSLSISHTHPMPTNALLVISYSHVK